MPIQGGYTDPNKKGSDDWVLLPAGPNAHACRLLPLMVEKQAPLPGSFAAKRGETEVTQLRWTFEGIKFKGPVNEAGVVKKGVVSVWTGFNYGSPKAKLTHLLNALFGRPLTEEEAKRLDYEKIGNADIQGWVTVTNRTKADGSPGTGFGGFFWPDGKTPPQPSEFFLDEPGTPTGGGTAAASAPLPEKTNPFGDGGEDEDDGDPFQE